MLCQQSQNIKWWHKVLYNCTGECYTFSVFDTKLDLSKWNTNEPPTCKHWYAKLSLDNHKYCSVMLCSHKKPLHDIVIKAESHSLTTQAELYEDNVWESAHTSPQNRKKTWSQHLMSKYQRTRTHTMNLLPFLKLLLSLLQYRVHRVAFDLLITSWKRTLGSGWIERGTWAVVITGQKKRTGLKNRRIEKNWIHALISKS